MGDLHCWTQSFKFKHIRNFNQIYGTSEELLTMKLLIVLCTSLVYIILLFVSCTSRLRMCVTGVLCLNVALSDFSIPRVLNVRYLMDHSLSAEFINMNEYPY